MTGLPNLSIKLIFLFLQDISGNMGNDHTYDKALYEFLSGYITQHKLAKFQEIINMRTRFFTVVLEDIYQPHNASAVLRSCDCFGILDVHVIENRNTFQVSKDVALGAQKWLNVLHYRKQENNTESCLLKLRDEGYRIIATTPHTSDISLDDFPAKEKTAFVFGTELEGLSETALNLASGYVRIPMSGFTESLNISVSVAILLYEMTRKLHKSSLNWQLSDDEKADTLLSWARHVVKRADLLEENFRKSYFY